MATDDVLHGKRENEEEYFRKQDQELIERLRTASAAEKARRELDAATGLHDPELLKDLERLGFTAETASLLPLIPVLQVAWAEGHVTPAERALILDLAGHRGVVTDSPAGRQLAAWLAHAPAPSVFTGAMRLINAMLEAGSPVGGTLTAEDLDQYCERIAHASGGILGIGSVSSAERAVLEQIHAALKGRGKQST
jgi:tellurite resistance protein